MKQQGMSPVVRMQRSFGLHDSVLARLLGVDVGQLHGDLAPRVKARLVLLEQLFSGAGLRHPAGLGYYLLAPLQPEIRAFLSCVRVGTDDEKVRQCFARIQPLLLQIEAKDEFVPDLLLDDEEKELLDQLLSKDSESMVIDNRNQRVVNLKIRPLDPAHDQAMIEAFRAEPEYEEFLHHKACRIHSRHESKVYVAVIEQEGRPCIAGYFTLSMIAFDREILTKRLQHHLSYAEVQAYYLGMMSIDSRFKGMGIGSEMLQWAIDMLKAANEDKESPVWAPFLVVDPEPGKPWLVDYYARHGFRRGKHSKRRMFLPLMKIS